MTTWQDYMNIRVAGKEPGMPWFLHDKIKCYDFCRENGLATVKVLREFHKPSDIDLSNLPSEFVLKPTLQHSTRGVMVLKQEGARFYDRLRRRELSTDDIVEEQQKYFEQTEMMSKKIIIEEKIVDHDDFEVPRDFKAYCFRGVVALILEIDRNTTPPTIAWFDGEFNAVQDGRVTSNPDFVTERPAKRPKDWHAILDLAKRVSHAIPTPFASIDMYSTPDGPIVGEVTLAPGGLYYGKHYALSSAQQQLMGAMWRSAMRDLESPQAHPE